MIPSGADDLGQTRMQVTHPSELFHSMDYLQKQVRRCYTASPRAGALTQVARCSSSSLLHDIELAIRQDLSGQRTHFHSFSTSLPMMRAGFCIHSLLKIGLSLYATGVLADLEVRNDALVARTSITSCVGTSCAATTTTSCVGTSCPVTSGGVQTTQTSGTALLSYFRPGESLFLGHDRTI